MNEAGVRVDHYTINILQCREFLAAPRDRHYTFVSLMSNPPPIFSHDIPVMVPSDMWNVHSQLS